MRRYSIQRKAVLDQSNNWVTVTKTFTEKQAHREWAKRTFGPTEGVTLYRIWDNWNKEPVTL